MRFLTLIGALVVLFQGCIIISSVGVRVDQLQTREEVYAKLGQPDAVDEFPTNLLFLRDNAAHENYTTERFHRRKKLARGMTPIGGFPILSPIAWWEVTKDVTHDYVEGNDYEFAFDETGNVVASSPAVYPYCFLNRRTSSVALSPNVTEIQSSSAESNPVTK